MNHWLKRPFVSRQTVFFYVKNKEVFYVHYAIQLALDQA